jgi:hypothetical protein
VRVRVETAEVKLVRSVVLNSVRVKTKTTDVVVVTVVVSISRMLVCVEVVVSRRITREV